MEKREIKFRAWDTSAKYMTPINTIERIMMFSPLNSTNKNCIYLQFTGFKDNKGVEIYEGDILSDWVETDEGIKQSLMQVFWCDKVGGWKLDNSFGQNKSNGDLLSDELAGFNYEITGNIYANPKTIKK